MKDQPIENGSYMVTFINEHQQKWSNYAEYKDGKWFDLQGQQYELEPIDWKML